MRIAYLTSHYPAISHTFIQREIAALRRLGDEVVTFSVREPCSDDPKSMLDQQEFEKTTYILSAGWFLLLKIQVASFLANKKLYLRRLLFAVRLAGKSPLSMLLHFFLFIEAEFLRHQLKEQRIKHCHVHFAMSATTVAMIACYNGDYSFSFTIHGSQALADPDRYLLRKKIAFASAVICISNKGFELVRSLSDIAQHQKIHLVRCGIQVCNYQAIPVDNFRSIHTLSLLNVGRLVACKAQHLLISAMASFHPSEAHCVIVGGGQLNASLLKQIEQSKITNVKLVGAVDQDNISHYFANAQIFVLTSLDEGVPVVLMEAMAHGLAVIASDVGAVREIVQHEQTGLLVAPNSISEIVNAIERLHRDRAWCITLARNGRALVAREYNITTSSARLHNIFINL